MGGDPKNPVWPAARPFFLPLFTKSLVAAISEIRHLVYGRYDTWQMQAHEGAVEYPYYLIRTELWANIPPPQAASRSSLCP
jgi:hypothetical protein